MLDYSLDAHRYRSEYTLPAYSFTSELVYAVGLVNNGGLSEVLAPNIYFSERDAMEAQRGLVSAGLRTNENVLFKLVRVTYPLPTRKQFYKTYAEQDVTELEITAIAAWMVVTPAAIVATSTCVDRAVEAMHAWDVANAGDNPVMLECRCYGAPSHEMERARATAAIKRRRRI